MSLARAIETGDLAELPSRRDEDWRWTDLRGAIRTMPAPAADVDADGPGPFDGVKGGELTLARFVATEGTQSASLPMVFEAGTKTVLLESYEHQGGGYLHSVELDLELEGGAEVERIVLADDAADGVTVSQAQVRLAPGARFRQTVLTTGAKRQRIETCVTHPGQGAVVRLDGVYLIGGARHGDITTVVEHQGPGGETSQLTKGAVAGQGRAVFQGRIVVERGADGTDARMGHHALILSDRGEVDAKPELLIYADDVQCAHGNTVGALDEDALFYAEQRGIPAAAAKAMLTEAFIGEVIDRIEHDGARAAARAWATRALAGLS
ncbi:Fe-S cluster assembly protein SufD [soil metagenome]